MTITALLQLLCLIILIIIWTEKLYSMIADKCVIHTRTDKMILLSITMFLIILLYADISYLYISSMMTIREIMVIIVLLLLTIFGLIALFWADLDYTSRVKIQSVQFLTMTFFMMWICEIVYLVGKI